MRAIIYSDNGRLASHLAEVLAKHSLYPSIEKLECCRPEKLEQMVHPQLIFLATSKDIQVLQPTVAKIAQTSAHTIVAVGRATTPAVIVEIIRSGAFDFIDPESQLDREIANLIHRIDSQPGEATGSRQTLGILSTGNVHDANLLATNLAVLRGEAFGGCHLLELRDGFGDLAACLQLTPYHTTADLAAQPDFDLQMFQQALAKHRSGIELLAAPSGHVTEPLPSIIVKKLIAMSRQDMLPTVACFDDVMHVHDLSNFLECEQVIVPTRLDFASIWRTKHTLDRLFSDGIGKESIHVVAIETKTGVQPPLSDVRDVLNRIQLHRLQMDDVNQEISINLGQPVVQNAPRSPMSRSFAVIAEELADGTPRLHRNYREKLAVSLRSASTMISSLLERTH